MFGSTHVSSFGCFLVLHIFYILYCIYCALWTGDATVSHPRGRFPGGGAEEGIDRLFEAIDRDSSSSSSPSSSSDKKEKSKKKKTKKSKKEKRKVRLTLQATWNTLKLLETMSVDMQCIYTEFDIDRFETLACRNHKMRMHLSGRVARARRIRNIKIRKTKIKGKGKTKIQKSKQSWKRQRN